MFFLIPRPPPRTTTTDTLVPDTSLVRAHDRAGKRGACGSSQPGAELSLVEAGFAVRAGAGKGLRAIGPGGAGRLRPCALQRAGAWPNAPARSEEHTSELQSLIRIPYAVFCLKKKKDQRKKLTQQKR